MKQGVERVTIVKLSDVVVHAYNIHQNVCRSEMCAI